MINLVYLGLGGKHSKLVCESIRRLNYRHSASLSKEVPEDRGFTVAVCAAGIPATVERMKDILKHPTVTFIVGDVHGIPVDIVRNADCVLSVGWSMPLQHEMQAVVIGELLEQYAADVCPKNS